MPIHDWTRVPAGIFHHFHHEWISRVQSALNHGILPPNYYALAEQVASEFVPDVLTLEAPTTNGSFHADPNRPGGVKLATATPRVKHHFEGPSVPFARKAKTVAIRHISDHRTVAVIEIVSPGNKGGTNSIRSFVEKSAELIEKGIHLLVIDLFPPTPRDPKGIHPEIWSELIGDFPYEIDESLPLTLASYVAGVIRHAYVEPTAVGNCLVDMPVFLDCETYVLLPLEPTYNAAWDDVPPYWRAIIEGDVKA